MPQRKESWNLPAQVQERGSPHSHIVGKKRDLRHWLVPWGKFARKKEPPQGQESQNIPGHGGSRAKLPAHGPNSHNLSAQGQEIKNISVQGKEHKNLSSQGPCRRARTSLPRGRRAGNSLLRGRISRNFLPGSRRGGRFLPRGRISRVSQLMGRKVGVSPTWKRNVWSCSLVLVAFTAANTPE